MKYKKSRVSHSAFGGILLQVLPVWSHISLEMYLDKHQCTQLSKTLNILGLKQEIKEGNNGLYCIQNSAAELPTLSKVATGYHNLKLKILPFL